jgi:hypothetical protein
MPRHLIRGYFCFFTVSIFEQPPPKSFFHLLFGGNLKRDLVNFQRKPQGSPSPKGVGPLGKNPLGQSHQEWLVFTIFLEKIEKGTWLTSGESLKGVPPQRILAP